MTVSESKNQSNGISQYTLSKSYTFRISEAGGVPVAAVGEIDHAARYAALSDALLVTGGGDISPALFEEKENPMFRLDAEPLRDAFELALIGEFVKLNKPVLGICRGMQITNVFFGGSLWQDLPFQLGISHSKIEHTVSIKSGTFMEKLFGDELKTNSFHHQAVKKLGNGLVPAAWAGEIIEAFEHGELPIFGVQFHPERMASTDRLFEFFVSVAAERAGGLNEHRI